jgi:Rha family phage regulatory protein
MSKVSESKVPLSHEQRVELAMATIQPKEAVLGVLSTQVAEKFGKEHKNVLRDIENLISTVDAEFSRLNFEPSTYVDGRGKTHSAYILTEAGFSLLVMGFTGEEAVKWKIAYITAFQRMREALLNRKPDVDPFSGLSPEVRAIFCMDRKLQVVEAKLASFEEKVMEAEVTRAHLSIELTAKADAADERLSAKQVETLEQLWHNECYLKHKDKRAGGKAVGDIKGMLKRRFLARPSTCTYKDIAQRHFDLCVIFSKELIAEALAK